MEAEKKMEWREGGERRVLDISPTPPNVRSDGEERALAKTPPPCYRYFKEDWMEKDGPKPPLFVFMEPQYLRKPAKKSKQKKKKKTMKRTRTIKDPKEFASLVNQALKKENPALP